MTRLRPDDSVHEVQGTWVDANGSEMWVHWSWTTRKLVLIVGLPVAGLSWLGGAALKDAATVGGVAWGLTAMWISGQVSRDRTPTDVLRMLASEARTWWWQRRRNARAVLDEQPVRITHRRTHR